jgi:hypothetical protein
LRSQCDGRVSDVGSFVVVSPLAEFNCA